MTMAWDNPLARGQFVWAIVLIDRPGGLMGYGVLRGRLSAGKPTSA